MSVILDALRQRKDEMEKSGANGSPTLDEGLFLERSRIAPSQRLTLSRSRAMLLAGLVVVVGACSVGLWWLSREERTASTPVAASAAPLAPASSGAAPVVQGKSAAETIAEARHLFQTGQLAESLKLYEQAVATEPRNAELLNDMGMILLKQELYSSAAEHFSRALELDHHCAACFNNFGYLKTLLGESVEAEKYLKKATELDAAYPDPHFNLGVLYEKNGDIGQAVAAYQEFLRRASDPNAEVVKKVQGHVRELTGE